MNCPMPIRTEGRTRLLVLAAALLTACAQSTGPEIPGGARRS